MLITFTSIERDSRPCQGRFGTGSRRGRCLRHAQAAPIDKYGRLQKLFRRYRLGATRGLPIAVVAFGWSRTLRAIAEVLPGAARRQELSDDGHVLIDAPMPAQADPRSVAAAIKRIAGVVDHGFFLDLSLEVFVGTSAGIRVL